MDEHNTDLATVQAAPKKKTEWTDEQKLAIHTRDRTILVSAAAGSGKTAVLTERIIQMLLGSDTHPPADISRMLIVTFTRAAAGELRQRIGQALSDAALELRQITPADDAQKEKIAKQKKHLSNQLMLLGSAAISTIDSFYYDLVRSHFQEAGISPSVRLADENELLGLKKELMEEVVDRMYREEADFALISDILCDLRSESALTDALLEIYNKMLRYPEGIDFLALSAQKMENCKGEVLRTPWGAYWEKEMRTICETGRRLFANALDLLTAENKTTKTSAKYGVHFNEYLDRYRTIIEHLDNGDYAAARDAAAAPFISNLKGTKATGYAQEFVDQKDLCMYFRKEWQEKHAPALSAFTPAEIAQSAAEGARALSLLHKTLAAFEGAYQEAKARREVAEFSDISRAAYRLLVERVEGDTVIGTALAAEIAKKYDTVYIDEYQDVDKMQDATFCAITPNNNRFMVGDIKQSIYRFRGAQPDVFRNYRNSFSLLEKAKENDPVAIFMSNCFRCDKPIIDFSNAVSGDLFAANAESVGYTKEDDLVFTEKKDPPEISTEKCHVVLINRKKEDQEYEDNEKEVEEVKASKLEARWIAAKIGELLKEPKGNGKKSQTAEGEEEQPTIEGKDIAVLMRNATLAPYIAEYLGQMGIPVNDTSRKSFFENPDVLCVYSLLAALDNPFRDVYMAATLRSPFFGFSLEDLVQLHANAPQEASLYEAVTYAAQTAAETDPRTPLLSNFTKRFSLWRKKAETLPVDRLLRYLYQESAILSFAGRADKDAATPETRRANLHRLYEYARTFESGGFKGLYQFVRYVDGIMENEGKMPSPEGAQNAVSLITIHHSKGLQFPICFLAGTATRFNDKDLAKPFLEDEELGCAIRLPNAGPFSRANTFFREAVKARLRRRSVEEEMRVLYVAMTRAQNRLYVVADSPYGVEHLEKRARLTAAVGGDFVVRNGPAYIYWILASLERRDHAPYATIETVEEADIPLIEPKEPDTPPSNTSEPVEKAKGGTLFDERFSFRYPYEHLTKLPAKMSVSRLSPTVLDVYGPDAEDAPSIDDFEGIPAPSDKERAVKPDEDMENLLRSFDQKPSFDHTAKEPSAAECGTATHEFLQFCSFENIACEGGVEAELARLTEKRYFTRDTKDLVRLDELELFKKSELYRELKEADPKKIFRETRFHLSFPAKDFTKNPEFVKALGDEEITVQGVIDLFYYDKNGKLILCDYKTDRITAEKTPKKLVEIYKNQLTYYARAIEQLCGRAPDKIILYSLHLGRSLDVQL